MHNTNATAFVVIESADTIISKHIILCALSNLSFGGSLLTKTEIQVETIQYLNDSCFLVLLNHFVIHRDYAKPSCYVVHLHHSHCSSHHRHHRNRKRFVQMPSEV